MKFFPIYIHKQRDIHTHAFAQELHKIKCEFNIFFMMAKIILQDYETPNPDLLSCGRPEGVWIMRLRYSWQKKKKWSTYVILTLIRNVAFNIYQLNGYPTKYSLPSSVWTLKLHAWFVCSWKIWICQSVLVSPLIKKIPQHSFTNHVVATTWYHPQR